MALIASLVQSVVSALGGVAGGFRWKDEDKERDLGSLISLFGEKVGEFVEEHPEVRVIAAFRSPAALAAFTVRSQTHEGSFLDELFTKYNDALQGIFALLNVEVAQATGGPGANLAAQIEQNLEDGRTGAQERVTVAITAINFIVLTASAISILAEVATLGQVDTVADAIQSWVWANGLGSFSPMAFTPQLNASVNPYLNRYYNSRAQAQIPPVTDVIRFQLREVFLEGRREELVGTEERPIYNALMKEWGYNQFHADSYWGAHWGLPSQGQLNEMLHRGVIDDATWNRFTRFNDVEPTTIPWLHDIIFNPFTRVDVRRMSRFGILSDDELLQAYADLGFFAPTERRGDGTIRAVMVPNPDFTIHKAQAQVIFTKVFNAIPLLRQRFSKGWITPDEVLDGLRESGVGEGTVQALFETIVKEVGPERTAPEKSLTRGLVARAWKLRQISFPQATFLLQRMGWSEPEAELILRVQSLPDDPMAFVGTELGFRLSGSYGVPLGLEALDVEGE